jgi:ABC transporter substrate binding protein
VPGNSGYGGQPSAASYSGSASPSRAPVTGTVFAQIGAGYRDAWFTVTGGIVGAMTFGYLEPVLRPILLSGGPGKPTFDQSTHVPFWALALGMAALLAAALGTGAPAAVARRDRNRHRWSCRISRSPLILGERTLIADLALKTRLPTISLFTLFPKSGGPIAYGPNLPDMYKRAATVVDRILKGARVGEMPIERPSRFDLVINLKTAKALGVTKPPALLARADEVIE